MRAFRAPSRLAGWIAALAMVLASLAPALSHALAGTPGGPWGEICTAQGPQWLGEGSGGGTPDAGTHGPFDHCPFCSLHAPDPGMPPTADGAPWQQQHQAVQPPADDASPPQPQAWNGARPRAPPRAA